MHWTSLDYSESKPQALSLARFCIPPHSLFTAFILSSILYIPAFGEATTRTCSDTVHYTLVQTKVHVPIGRTSSSSGTQAGGKLPRIVGLAACLKSTVHPHGWVLSHVGRLVWWRLNMWKLSLWIFSKRTLKHAFLVHTSFPSFKHPSLSPAQSG